MRRIGRRAALMAAGIAVVGGVSSSGRFLVAEPVPEEKREELFEFAIEPGIMNPRRPSRRSTRGGSWRSAEFLVRADVARVEATAADGTVYTVTPLDGFGYIEWPDERGSLELVAYDADGEELGRNFAGFDR